MDIFKKIILSLILLIVSSQNLDSMNFIKSLIGKKRSGNGTICNPNPIFSKLSWEMNNKIVIDYLGNQTISKLDRLKVLKALYKTNKWCRNLILNFLNPDYTLLPSDINKYDILIAMDLSSEIEEMYKNNILFLHPDCQAAQQKDIHDNYIKEMVALDAKNMIAEIVKKHKDNGILFSSLDLFDYLLINVKENIFCELMPLFAHLNRFLDKFLVICGKGSARILTVFWNILSRRNDSPNDRYNYLESLKCVSKVETNHSHYPVGAFELALESQDINKVKLLVNLGFFNESTIQISHWPLIFYLDRACRAYVATKNEEFLVIILEGLEKYGPNILKQIFEAVIYPNSNFNNFQQIVSWPVECLKLILKKLENKLDFKKIICGGRSLLNFACEFNEDLAIYLINDYPDAVDIKLVDFFTCASRFTRLQALLADKLKIDISVPRSK